ncbi:MAG: C25 family cysteine peptidase [Saprospiraceae bacterium]
MKNLITFLFYCFSVTALIAQVQSDTRVQVLSNTGEETVIRLTLSGVAQTAVTTPEGPAVVVSMAEGTPLLRAGAPDVPKFAAALALPVSGSMAVEIIGGEYEDIGNVDVAPSKGNLLRTVNPADVPYTYSSLYQEDAFFPGKLAEMNGDPFIFRDVRGQALWIYPVQYNPVSKTLRVYHDLVVRVFRSSDTGPNELADTGRPGASRSFRQLYAKTFLNYDDKFLLQSRGLTAAPEPEKMLVIAKDEFIPALEPYVAWKRQSGISTTVVATSEIPSLAPDGIYSFVSDYYAANGITYLLLVGDESALEPLVRPGSPYSCDNCLGYQAGDDHFPEILVGRFNAATVEQVQIMVNRNLEYEKNPLVDEAANWCATGMASASNEGQGIGDDNQADYEQGNEWKSAHLADGFEKYWEFYDGNHGGISPTPGDETADQNGNPVNTQLVNLMNNRGVSLYNYTGHGWEQGLVSGNFNTDAVAALRNEHRYPIIIAVACCAGNFTNNNGGDCLGEAVQRAGNPATGEVWGAIAGFFSSDFQSWAPPMEGQDGMNQYLIDADGITLKPNLGAMGAYGNALMIAAYGQGGIDMADVWNPFLDPTTVPRTRLPQALAATHQSSTYVGTTSLSVSSDVEGALVSLYWQNQTLAVGIVENGVAVLEFPALNNVGEITVTVSQFNYIPYQGVVNVAVAGVPFVVNESVLLNDPAGNNNQQADYGETVNMDVTLANVGIGLANATSATLSSTDDNIVLLDAMENFGDIDDSTSIQIPAAFSFTVNDDVADGHIVNFNLHIEYNTTESFDIVVPVKLQAPKLVVDAFTINDSQGGNGNGRLESGETAQITVKNLNTGKSQSPDALGILTTGSPWLTLSGPSVLGPMYAVSGQSNAVFTVAVSPDAPQVVSATFDYQVVAGNYEASKSFGPFVINAIIENFGSGNFQSFPWQMGGNKPWTISTANPYEGTSCARSGSITHNQKSEMFLSLDVTADGSVSFARKTSTEQDYDFLRFYIDDVKMGEWSGENAWQEVSFPVGTGSHLLRWVYEKDEVSSAGSDRCWVDQISLPPHQVAVGTHTPDSEAVLVQASPNPTTGPLNVGLELSKEQRIDMALFDLLGRQLRGFEGRLAAGATTQAFDMSGLAPGVYLLQVRGENFSRTVKIVRQ